MSCGWVALDCDRGAVVSAPPARTAEDEQLELARPMPSNEYLRLRKKYR
jgi:hypothetical protein